MPERSVFEPSHMGRTGRPRLCGTNDPGIGSFWSYPAPLTLHVSFFQGTTSLSRGRPVLSVSLRLELTRFG